MNRTTCPNHVRSCPVDTDGLNRTDKPSLLEGCPVSGVRSVRLVLLDSRDDPAAIERPLHALKWEALNSGSSLTTVTDSVHQRSIGGTGYQIILRPNNKTGSGTVQPRNVPHVLVFLKHPQFDGLWSLRKHMNHRKPASYSKTQQEHSNDFLHRVLLKNERLSSAIHELDAKRGREAHQ